MAVFGGSDNSGQRARKSSRLFKPQKLVLTRMAKGVDGLKDARTAAPNSKAKIPHTQAPLFMPHPSLPSHSRSTTEPPHPLKGVGGRAGQ